MKVTVRYFASIREAVGQGTEALQTRGETLGALRDDGDTESDLPFAGLKILKTPEDKG